MPTIIPTPSVPPIPTGLQYFDFLISVIGFLLTLGTFVVSLNVKKHLRTKAETDSFRTRKNDILDKVEGFIHSINEDHIFDSDDTRSFQSSISQFLTDIETSFSFLSKPSKKMIKSIRRRFQTSSLSYKDWDEIASDLVSLRNYLNKELI